jgi:thiol-disulfide isomerase/thioredoxin
MNLTMHPCALLLSFCLAVHVSASPPAELPATDGRSYAPLDAGGRKAVLLFFVSPFCSTTRPFMKEINAVASEYFDRVAVALVHSDSEITVETAFQHADLEQVKVRVLVDKQQLLARHLGATTTPEAVVVSPGGEVLYKGRINDLYLGPTKRQRVATTRDLRDALDAILVGRPVSTPQCPAQGCRIGGLK